VSSLAIKDTNLYAGTFSNGVFFSTNNGISWNSMNTGFSNQYSLTIRALSVSPNVEGRSNILAGMMEVFIF